MKAWLLQFWRRCEGAAAVEMAFVVPVIDGLALVSFGVWDAASRLQDMRAALGVAADYYMSGGVSDATAQSTALKAWRKRPAESSIALQRVCRCGVEALSCASLCANDAPPSVYVEMTATGGEPNALFGSRLTAERVVRVR